MNKTFQTFARTVLEILCLNIGRVITLHDTALSNHGVYSHQNNPRWPPMVMLQTNVTLMTNSQASLNKERFN